LLHLWPKSFIAHTLLNKRIKPRKPCYRQENAQCRSYCLSFKVCQQHSLQV